jgi:hypothetical protein
VAEYLCTAQGGDWPVFYWQDGKIRDLGFSGDPVAINEGGVVIGG